jgi:hypothetical protein
MAVLERRFRRPQSRMVVVVVVAVGGGDVVRVHHHHHQHQEEQEEKFKQTDYCQGKELRYGNFGPPPCCCT